MTLWPVETTNSLCEKVKKSSWWSWTMVLEMVGFLGRI